MIQRITKETLRATEAWTDGRYAENARDVELDCELAVAQLPRATVLKVAQTKPSHGFVAWQALVDGCAPKSSNDPATALQTVLATPKRCKDAKLLKERLTAWSLEVAEHEHQFKVIDEAQKIFVVREMMADDGPTPVNLGNVGAYDAKTTQSGLGHEQRHVIRDVCAIAWKRYKAGKGRMRKCVWRRKADDRWNRERGFAGATCCELSHLIIE